MGREDRMRDFIVRFRHRARAWPAQTKLVLVLSLIWFSRGVTTAMTADVWDAGQPHQMLPIMVRGMLWIVCGLLAVWFVYRGKRHAFSVLMVMPAAMFLSYTFDAVMSITPPNPPGSFIAWPSLGYYGGFTILLWLLGRIWPTRQEGAKDDAKLGI